MAYRVSGVDRRVADILKPEAWPKHLQQSVRGGGVKLDNMGLQPAQSIVRIEVGASKAKTNITKHFAWHSQFCQFTT